MEGSGTRDRVGGAGGDHTNNAAQAVAAVVQGLGTNNAAGQQGAAAASGVNGIATGRRTDRGGGKFKKNVRVRGKALPTAEFFLKVVSVLNDQHFFL